MKKILLLTCIILFTIFSGSSSSYAVCNFDGTGEEPISRLVDGCLSDSLVVDPPNVEAGNGTNTIINKIIGNLGVLLSIGAVLMIAYSGLLMTLSGGEDEKVKKGKDLLKWTLIGYIALLTAGGIVSLIISTIYGFSS